MMRVIRRRAVRSTRRAMRRLPMAVRIQGMTLAVAMVAASVVPALSGQAGYERVSFAVPAQARDATVWKERVADFADRMHHVFRVNRRTAGEFSGWILEAADRHHLTPELVASVVFTESSFRKNVVSHAGAIGPAQVQPYWNTFCGNANLDDPAENIYCGAQILAHFRDECGAERCALQAYNVGLNNRDDEFAAAGARYVAKIDRHLERFDKTML
jgi:soluble lytic murein transglycosylase-like protein